MKRTKFVIGNWKMNGLKSSMNIYEGVNKHMLSNKKSSDLNVVICPPFTLINLFSSKKTSKIMIGAQDTHEKESGAYTGSISSQMLSDLGAGYVIIGHSERRQYFGENVKLLADKIIAAQKADLKVIFCIGELKNEIKNRKSVLRKQLKSLPKKLNYKNIIIAYEPVWAIGTGLIPSFDEINSIHLSIRDILKYDLKFSKNVSILYGGSVNPKNASNILSLENVDGALVGGASLNSKDFSNIIDYYT
jgi:triosephosphate isomerase|tara:strand:- start:8206 stop:8946 length:741 start_codon:yes stop_codon:yes gene_type:complete